MHSNMGATEWKPKERIGKDWQGQSAMPFLSAVELPELAPLDFIARSDHTGAIRYANLRSGLDDFEVADQLAISHGYMSKVLHGTAGLWGPRLVRFMRVTHSLAPLQWLADQMGCDVVQRDSRAAEVAELRSRLRELEKAA